MRFDFAAFRRAVLNGLPDKVSPNLSTVLAAGGVSFASLMVGYVVLFGGGERAAEPEIRANAVAVTGPVFTPVVATPAVTAEIETSSSRAEAMLPMPQDARSLTRAVQTGLKRAGCYAGPVNGVWTNRTSAAMDEFTARVNARLPVDKPDGVLLALLETHDDVSCGPDGAPAARRAETESAERERATVTREAVLSSSAAVVAETQARAEHLSYADETRPMSRTDQGASVKTASVGPEERAETGRTSVMPAAIVPAPKVAKRERSRRSTRKVRRKPSFSREVRRSFRSIQRSMRGLF